MSQKIYDLITDRIIALLEQGDIPWRKPWKPGDAAPRNSVSGKPYRGINAMLLSSLGFASPWFATFRQIQGLGGSVRKGAHGFPVVFWKFFGAAAAPDGEDEQAERRERVPLLRYYTVFNLEQAEGIPADKIPPPVVAPAGFSSIDVAEKIVAGMPQRPEILHQAGDRACYRPATDTVILPNRELFASPEEYYSTEFHELVHATGAGHRLARKSLADWAPFGSADYSREELVAEMGAGFLCAHAGVSNATLENSAAYIQSWLQVLKDDRRAVIVAAGQAQKAADFILNSPAEDDPNY
ncbi:MAG TPA: zincin-like metallopeptidase domain-containing protein [Acidobacteriota bacterium]|nr:zincin-like metallopeptidase domain-containing protein [Acidobacteriota bacterium]